jgi:hypothetical protein
MDLRAWLCCSLFVLAPAACGGDRQSGAVASRDTGPSSVIANGQTATSDTASAGADSASVASRFDTGSSGTDTAGRASTTPSPTPGPKPARKPAAKPVRPTPPAATETTSTATADTAPTAAAPAQQTDTATTAAAAAPLRDEYHQAPRDTVSPQVYDGWKQYNLNCARCHGEDVLGTTIAPHLIVSLKPNGPINTNEAFVQVVCAGRPEKGMPAWCPLGLDMDKIQAIYAYVKGRSEGQIHPGRPARRE